MSAREVKGPYYDSKGEYYLALREDGPIKEDTYVDFDTHIAWDRVDETSPEDCTRVKSIVELNKANSRMHQKLEKYENFFQILDEIQACDFL